MFVKLYRYKIKHQDLPRWKKITSSTQKIYKENGGGNSKRLLRKNGIYIRIVELDFYDSKKAFLKISRQVDKDQRIAPLFKEFLECIYRKQISSEEYEEI